MPLSSTSTFLPSFETMAGSDGWALGAASGQARRTGELWAVAGQARADELRAPPQARAGVWRSVGAAAGQARAGELRPPPPYPPVRGRRSHARSSSARPGAQ